MAEFKLICPGCGAEYALPPGAIPPEGREVECSDCGHVWQARPAAAPDRLDLSGFAQPAAAPQPVLPPAHQRLSPDMMDLLQAEVEHERRLRAADQAAPTTPSDPASPPEPDWPATTLTAPESGTAMVPLLAPPRRATTQAPAPEPARPAKVIRHAPPTPDPTPVAEPQPSPPEASYPRGYPPATPRRSRGYGLGLTVMLLIAAAVVAFYVLAPGRVAEGSLFATWHDQLNAARSWLDRLIR